MCIKYMILFNNNSILFWSINGDIRSYYKSLDFECLDSEMKPFGKGEIDLTNNVNTNLNDLCDIDCGKICQIACNAHSKLCPSKPILGWDVAFNENKKVILIEANATYTITIQSYLQYDENQFDQKHAFVHASAMDYLINMAID